MGGVPGGADLPELPVGKEGLATSPALRQWAMGGEEEDPPLPVPPCSSNDILNAMRRATSSTSMFEPLDSAPEPPLLPLLAIGSEGR